MSTINDIDKIKIDILRDSLKDVADTIRALDRKIIFLVSYNAIFLGAIGAIVIKKSDIVLHHGTITSLFAIFVFFWISFLIGIMFNINPMKNPLSALYTREQPEFKNMFFISVSKEQKHSIKYLTECYDKKVDNIKEIKMLLYGEIIKLSSIRDERIKKIKFSSMGSYIFTLLFGLIFLSYMFSNL